MPPRNGTCEPQRPLSQRMTFSESQNDLINVLALYSPSSILKDDALLAHFRQFFQRGTIDECCELLPREFGATDVFTSIQYLRAPFQAAHVAKPRQHQPHDAEHATPQSTTPHEPTPSSTVTKPPSATEQYLRSTSIPKKKLPRLIRVANHMAKARVEKECHRPKAWEGFASKDLIAQAMEIYRMIEEPLQEQTTTTYRNYIIYFGNAVDKCAASDLALSSGRSSKSAALDKLAEKQKTERAAVAKVYGKYGTYMTCAELGGPGSLRSMKGSKTDIEKLNKEDIQLLFNCRKDELPNDEKQSRALDFEVVHDLIGDLRAQGWKDADIAKGRTRLTILICRYVDTASLIQYGKVISSEHRGGEKRVHEQARKPGQKRRRLSQDNHTITFDREISTPSTTTRDLDHLATITNSTHIAQVSGVLGEVNPALIAQFPELSGPESQQTPANEAVDPSLCVGNTRSTTQEILVGINIHQHDQDGNISQFGTNTQATSRTVAATSGGSGEAARQTVLSSQPPQEAQVMSNSDSPEERTSSQQCSTPDRLIAQPNPSTSGQPLLPDTPKNILCGVSSRDIPPLCPAAEFTTYVDDIVDLLSEEDRIALDHGLSR